MVNFPTSLDSLSNPTPSTYTDDAGFELDTVIGTLNDIAEAVEAKLGLGATTPVRNTALVGGASGSVWDAMARKNVLANGDFRINQRGTFPTADNAYSFDRWRVLMEAASSCTVSQETSDVPSNGSQKACKLSATATNNNQFGIFQAVETLDTGHLRGNTFSLQFKAKVSNARIGTLRAYVLVDGGTADAVSADPITTWGAEGAPITTFNNPGSGGTWAPCAGGAATFTPTTSWVTYRIEGMTTVGAMTNLAVLIYSNDKTTTNGDYLLITDVQLEQGAVCTDVEREPYASALQRCKRYYEVFGGAGLFELVGAATCITTTVATAGARWQVEKRVAPTISFSAVGDFCLAVAAGQVTTTVLSASSTSRRDTLISATVAAGLTAGQAANLVANNTLNARMTMDAEL